MEKRTWYYITPPKYFDVQCPKCKKTNIEWSEFQKYIWCYDCKEDLELRNDILFGSPIPINFSVHLLKMNFDRFNMETNEIEIFNTTSCDWDPLSSIIVNEKEYTKSLLRNDNMFEDYIHKYGPNILQRIQMYRESMNDA